MSNAGFLSLFQKANLNSCRVVPPGNDGHAVPNAGPR